MFRLIRSLPIQSLRNYVALGTTPTRRPAIARLGTPIASMDLRSAPGSQRQPIRCGRGLGGRRGKRSGRGQKGQRQRAGRHIPRGFEGGQAPIQRVLPRYGFTKNKAEYTRVHLSQLQKWIDQGRLDATEPITIESLLAQGLVHGVAKDGLVIGSGGADSFSTKVVLYATKVSASAAARIEALGGACTAFHTPRVTLVHMKRKAKIMEAMLRLKQLRDVVQNAMTNATSNNFHFDSPLDVLPAMTELAEWHMRAASMEELRSIRYPTPTDTKTRAYYLDARRRGYLSAQQRHRLSHPHPTHEKKPLDWQQWVAAVPLERGSTRLIGLSPEEMGQVNEKVMEQAQERKRQVNALMIKSVKAMTRGEQVIPKWKQVLQI